MKKIKGYDVRYLNENGEEKVMHFTILKEGREYAKKKLRKNKLVGFTNLKGIVLPVK